MSSLVTVDINNGIATVKLNRADKKNAISFEMFKAIRKVQKELSKNRNIRVVILSAHGEDFCSGIDVKSVLQSPVLGMKLMFKWLPGSANAAQEVCTGWRDLPVPVIAVINGRCWGGGFQIALGADFRFAHSDSNFSIMEAKWGLIPDMGGSVPLRELCSISTIKRLAMTAEIFDARYAEKIGVLDGVSDSPLKLAEALAEQLVKSSPDTNAGVKLLYNRSWTGSRFGALFRESWYQLRVIFGKNQRIATKRQRVKEGDPLPEYLPRKRW